MAGGTEAIRMTGEAVFVSLRLIFLRGGGARSGGSFPRLDFQTGQSFFDLLAFFGFSVFSHPKYE